MRNIVYLFIGLLLPLLVSCDDKRVYETNNDIENSHWKKKDTLRFDFTIEDANLPHNLYYNVRYTNTYPFYNLFTKYFLSDSTGQIIKSPAIPEDMYLFDPKTGEPYGKGLGDIYDQRISFLKDFKFPHSGNYALKVLQYMRNDSLPGVASFGIRVEKADVEKGD